jgi:hypothetical protein
MDLIRVVGEYRSREWFQRNQNQIKKIVVHHSAIKQDGRQTDSSILSAMQKHHEDQGWPGLSYHFAIMPTGTVYQINDFSDITWHDEVNNDSIGVVVHGYFHADINDHPTDAQLGALKELLDWLSTQCPQFPADQDDVVGHRDRASTACPGDILYPYVTEYREKVGGVSWIKEDQETIIKRLEARILSLEEDLKTEQGKGKTLRETIANLIEENKIKDKLMEKTSEKHAETVANFIEGIKVLKAKLKGGAKPEDFSTKELIEELICRVTRRWKQ